MLFLSTVTAVPADTLVSPQIIENVQVAEATTTLQVAEALPAKESPAPKSNDGIESVVREFYSQTPILAEVARCESKFKQYAKNGEIMRGIVREDVGVMQINEFYHGSTAKKLGLDLHTLEGNLTYAQYLYEKQGTQPWSASEHCWSVKN